jgi:hypothetical protein
MTTSDSTETKAFQFATTEDRPQLTEQELIFQALGAASTCWEDMSGTGVFDSERARSIGNALLFELGLPKDNFDPERSLSAQDQQALLRFTEPNFAVKDPRQHAVIRFRRTFYRAALATITAAPPSKSRAVALTELETAMMWAVKAFFGAPGE